MPFEHLGLELGLEGAPRAAALSGVTPTDSAGGTTEYDGFSAVPTETLITGGVTAGGTTTLHGKVKPGSFGKMLYNIATPQAGYTYTLEYTPDFSQLAQGGKLAMVGFGFKNGNNFFIVGLKGDGSTGLLDYIVEGATSTQNGWNKQTGQTVTNDGAPAHGTQAGPNYIQVEISADGTTATFRTSGDAGATWSSEIATFALTPFSNASGVLEFGPAVWINSADGGSFDVALSLWQSGVAAPGTTSARYWRFRITAFSGFPGISELQFAKLGHAMPTPSAYLSSSNHSEIGGGTGGTGAGLAFDGSDSTAWFASTASLNEWVGADFGSAIDVNVVRLRGRGGQYPTAGDVQHSSDGSTWVTAWSLSSLTASGDGPNVQATHPAFFPDPNKAGSSKVLWQLRGTASSTADAFSVGELQLRTTAGDASSNKVATAIKPWSNGLVSSFLPENVQDGNGATFWAAFLMPCSITFELALDTIVAELALMERSDSGIGTDYQSPKDFALYYSSDGFTYTLAHSWTGQSGFSPGTFKTFAI